MKNKTLMFCYFLQIFFLFSVRASDFSCPFEEVWKSKDPEKIIAFTELELQKKRSIETLFARGMVLNFLEDNPQEGIVLFDSAITIAKNNSNYSNESKLIIIKSLEASKTFLRIVIQLLGNSQSPVPQKNRKSQDIILSELGDEIPFPFSDALKSISDEIDKIHLESSK